jgi:hypothetical protein
VSGWSTFKRGSRDMRPVWELGLGALLVLLLTVAALKVAWIATNIGQATLLILILALCFGLYLIRNFFRMAYAIVEISIGLLAIFGAMGRAPEIPDEPTANLLIVQMAAGIYIVIRGFDNLAQSQQFAGGGAAFRRGWELLRARWNRNRTKD